MCVVYLYVVAVLEYIFGVAFQAVYKDVLREHERVGAIVQLNVFQFQTVYLPESLVCIIDGYVL